MLSSRSLLVLHVKHSSVSMSIPDSLAIPSPILFFLVLLSSRGRTGINASDFVFPVKAYCFPRLSVKIHCLMDSPGGPVATTLASLVAQTVQRLSAMRETRVQSLGWEDPLEKEMATHSSTLAWKIPWTEEPCKLQSMGSQRVGHD